MASLIRVAIVDDSALVRSVLSAIVASAPDMTVVGTAADPYQARELIRAASPDVITLDVEMPRMDGLDFLEKLMRLRPMPVVMVSTLTERGTETTLRALELGAVDFVAKPRLGVAAGLQDAGAELLEKLRIAARARVVRRPPAAPAEPSRPSPGAAAPRGGAAAVSSSRPATEAPPRRHAVGTEKIIAIGASTGGTEAVRVVLAALPPDAPAVVITQHMPPGFTRSFAERLDTLCRVRVAEAVDGTRLLPGHAYVAPGGHHLAVARSGSDYVAAVGDGDPVNRHRPSVEVLFDSVARVVGPNAIGVMLTGMGRDGADAMRRMREAGAHNLAQDEASCVVYGMPREAVLAGAVHESLPLARIAERIGALLAAGGVRHRV